MSAIRYLSPLFCGMFGLAPILYARPKKVADFNQVRRELGGKPGVIIHKRTSSFIDLEVPGDQVWIACSNTDPAKSTNSFIGVYITDLDLVYHFFYRAAIHDVSTCLKVEKEYRQLIQDAKIVRVAGNISNLPIEPAGQILNPQLPRRFQLATKMQTAVFLRLEANGKCKAYFSSDCELPKNYWAGTIPE